MSIEKNMNARIQHKHDIEANWNKALNFIPKIGEIIVYDIDENYNYSRFKIGDGVRTINNLEFLLDTQYILHNSNVLSQLLEQYNDTLATKQPVGDYALKSEIPKDYLTTIPAEYVTETELNAKGYLTSYTETDPTVPAWAKAATKPTYTASEVGALPANTVIPTVPTKVSAFTNDAGYLTQHQSLAGYATKTYANTAISNHNTNNSAHNDIRLLIEGLTNRLNTLADSDDTTLDQMSEIVAYIKSNKSLIEDVTTNKVNVADIINNLTTNVSNKPLSAAQGVVIQALIDDLQQELDTHTSNTTAHITSTERTNWNAAKTHADSTHAPSNAEKNQNAFSNIKVGSTTIAADTTTDTLELVGDNITITPDAANDKVTISITKDNVTNALGYTPPELDFFKTGIAIPSESDLDTYTTIGKYIVSSENIAKSLINSPTTTNFCMYVIVRTGGSAKTQIIIGLNGKMYIRSSGSNGAWRTWQTYVTQADLETIQTKLDGKADSVHGDHVPSCSASNNGQFLRVVNGVATWSTVPNAEEATF